VLGPSDHSAGSNDEEASQSSVWQLRNERKQFVALDLFAKNDFACRATTMKLKYILCQIYADKIQIFHCNNLLIVSTPQS